MTTQVSWTTAQGSILRTMDGATSAEGTFTVVPPGSSVLLNGHFAMSNYRINFEEEGSADRFSEVQGFNFGLDFKYILGEDNVEYGLEVVGGCRRIF